MQKLCQEESNLATVCEGRSSDVSTSSIFAEFPSYFSSALGIADCAPYEIELSDPATVRSSPYRCAPPKLIIFRKMVDKLLEQWVVRPSKSPYASPVFLVPMSGGGFRSDYRKANSNAVFDSYPMPTIMQAFVQCGGAAVFSVLGLNSNYYQIPLSHKSRQITDFVPHSGSLNSIYCRWGLV